MWKPCTTKSFKLVACAVKLQAENERFSCIHPADLETLVTRKAGHSDWCLDPGVVYLAGKYAIQHAVGTQVPAVF